MEALWGMLVKLREESWRQVDVSVFKKSGFKVYILGKKIGGSDSKESTLAMQETQVWSLGREENPMDRGAWRATVHGVAESQT